MDTDVASIPVRPSRRILFHPILAFVLLAPVLSAAGDRPRTLAQVVSAAAKQAQPIVTVLPAASGAPLQSYSTGGASLSMGRAAYYGGVSAPGVSTRKSSASMVLSTRFDLQVDCGDSPSSSLVEIVVSMADASPRYTVTIDGAKLSSMAWPTTLRCGSRTGHVVEVEVPKDRPAGPIASTISFSATPKY